MIYDILFISIARFQNNLPHLINPIESKLGTSTSNDINLIIYLLEEKYCPLFIKTSSGQLKDVNSFLSPQFGAVILYNHRFLISLFVINYILISVS